MKVSYLSQPVTLPYLVPSKTNLELELKVLQHRQGAYDTGYRAIQNARQKSLNIHFTNQAANGKIKTLNSTIDKQLEEIDGNFGDLSNNNLTNHYLGLFNEYSKNGLPELYRKEASIRQTRDNLRVMKKSKDPKKAGYSNMHEYVYRQQLAEYADIDNINDAMGHELPNYVPYKNTPAEMVELGNKLPWQETERIVYGEDGQMLTIKEKSKPGLDKLLSQIAYDNAEQYQVEAQFKYMTQIKGDSQAKQQVIDNHNSKVLDRKNRLIKEKNAIKESDFETKELYTEALINKQEEINNSTPVSYDISDDIFINKVLTTELMNNHVEGMTQSLAPVSSSEKMELNPIYEYQKNHALALRKQKFAEEKQKDNYNLEVLKFGQDVKEFKYRKAQDTKKKSRAGEEGSSLTYSNVQIPITGLASATVKDTSTMMEYNADKYVDINKADYTIHKDTVDRYKSRLSDIEKEGQNKGADFQDDYGQENFSNFDESNLTPALIRERNRILQILESPVVTSDDYYKNVLEDSKYYDGYKFGHSATNIAAKEEIEKANLNKEELSPALLQKRTIANLENSSTLAGKIILKGEKIKKANPKIPNIIDVNQSESLSLSRARLLQQFIEVPTVGLLEGPIKDNEETFYDLRKKMANNVWIRGQEIDGSWVELSLTNFGKEHFNHQGFDKDGPTGLAYLDFNASQVQKDFAKFKNITVEQRKRTGNAQLDAEANKTLYIINNEEFASGRIWARYKETGDYLDHILKASEKNTSTEDHSIELTNKKKLQYRIGEVSGVTTVAVYDDKGEHVMLNDKKLYLEYNSGVFFGDQNKVHEAIKLQLEGLVAKKAL